MATCAAEAVDQEAEVLGFHCFLYEMARCNLIQSFT